MASDQRSGDRGGQREKKAPPCEILCAQCRKPGTTDTLKACSRCRRALYCNAQCQRAHWIGGHKKVCKPVGVTPVPPQPQGSAAAEEDSGPRCIICLSGGDPPPIPSGCGCRGAAGLAHVACRAEAAIHATLKNPDPKANPLHPWTLCGTCRSPYQGEMKVMLIKAYWDAVKDGPKNEAWVIAAAFWGMHQVELGQLKEGRILQKLSIATAEKLKLPARLQMSLKTMSELNTGDGLANARKHLQAAIDADDDYGTGSARHMLGRALMEAGQLEEGVAALQTAYATYKKHRGAEDPPTLSLAVDLAGALKTAGKYGEALALCVELTPMVKRVVGPESYLTFQCASYHASLLGLSGQFQPAVDLCREHLAAAERALAPEHSLILGLRQLLDFSLAQLGQQPNA
eukprot:m.471916 g.471916  ORF g.471916 m.471916 type:complete len:401 (-) comp31906_c0_seq1:149-1351(-)